MRPRIRIFAVLLAALLALGLAACGGDGDDTGSETTSTAPSSGGTELSADSTPEEVLDAALGSDGDSVESGVIDLDLSFESDSADLGSAEATITGPFSSNGDGELPDVDFDVSASVVAGGPEISFAGGLVLTRNGLWVNYQDTDYQLEETAFAQVKDSYAKSAELQDQEGGESNSFSQFGIDPKTWLKDVSNDGIEDIDGTETVHVSGTGDVPKILGDLDSAARRSGQQQVDPAELGALEDSVTNATVDVFAATSDGSLRRIDVGLDIDDGTGSGSTVVLSIGIGEPNSDQSVSEPEDAEPLGDLLSQFSGATDSLGGLAPDTGGSSPGAAGGDEYFQCVQSAASAEAVDECSKLLQ